MMSELTQDDASAILMRLRNKIPPERISPVFVKTRAAAEVLYRARDMLDIISKQKIPVFLVINARRGAGKTAVIQYLREQLDEKVFFVYQEKSSTSAEDLFRYFVNRIGRQAIVDAVRNLSSDPLEVHRILSEKGHTGAATALAGLLEDSRDSWNWLAASSPALPKLECGLRLTRNARDNDALDALATVVKLLAYQKPVVFAVDELESAFNELKESQKGKLRSLLVDLINHTGFSRILFLFAATEHVYEKFIEEEEADIMGLTRRVKDATAILGLPTREETRKILDRILNTYSTARDFSFSESDTRRIMEEYPQSIKSAMPSDIISYALRRGDEKWEFVRRYEEIRGELESESGKIMEGLDAVVVGKKFEEAVGLLLKYIPRSERHVSQPDTDREREWLEKTVKGLKNIHKFLDWSFRLDLVDFWVEVCNTKKKDSVIPSNKALAVFAKTLLNEGSAGLFITHNYDRFGVGRGAGRVISRYPDLMKRVGILNLNEEQFRLLIGMLGVEGDRRLAAQFLFEKTGLDQMIEDLRGGKHFFW